MQKLWEFQNAEAPVEAPPSDHRRNALSWLTSQGQRSLDAQFGGVSPAEFEQLRSLIGNPAFGIFYSLLVYQRTNHLEQLSKTRLVNPEAISNASVIQGAIGALDQVRELLLDIADPQAQQADEGAA